MKKNPDKCHLVIRASAPKIMKIRVNSKKLIDVTINSKLNFNNNLDRILQKAGKKANVLAIVTPLMSILKRKFLMNVSFTKNFIIALPFECAIIV